MKDGWKYDAEKVKEGGYLINKSLLNWITIKWNKEPSCNDGEDAEAVLQGLQPHPNIKQLTLYYYTGVGFPRWGNYCYSSMNLCECLPKLVIIHLCRCRRLESLPLLSQLRHLKVLVLEKLTKLVYVESSISSSSRNGDNELLFFPSLTKLVLHGLSELKGWWKPSTSTSQPHIEATSTAGQREGGGEIGRGDVNQSNNKRNELQQSLFLGFPCLSTLVIKNCHKLETIPGFPNLKELYVYESNTLLLEHLHSLPRDSFHHLTHMLIKDDHKLERLSTVEVFTTGRLNSLRSLEINNCSKLKSISGRGVWEHFTALETLQLYRLPELELEDNDDDEMHMPWKWVASTLHDLKLYELDKMVKMPKGIQHLTSLRSLFINSPNLEEIPAWIG